MEEVKTIFIDFGTVFCGQPIVKSFKLNNQSKMAKTYVIVPTKGKICNTGCKRLKIRPGESVVSPGRSVSITLTYLSHLENVTDNVSYEIFDVDKFVMRLNVHARSIGPLLSPPTINVSFHGFHDIKDMVKHVELVNSAKCDAKFLFDSDNNNEIIQISRLDGLIPASTKINIKLTFRPKECGIYYKQIFCLVQFHRPIILNVLGIYNPKLRVNPKTFIYKYPFHNRLKDTNLTYIETLKESVVSTDKKPFSQKCLKEYLTSSEGSTANFEETEREFSVSQKILPVVYIKDEVVLTKHFVDVKNLPEVCQATALINLSKGRQYFYCWSHDFRDNFEVVPCRGFVQPEQRIDFTVRFVAPIPDQVLSTTFDIRVFPSDEDNDDEMSDRRVQLPLTMTFRVLGNSFSNDSCGWVPQCRIDPKVLQLPSCVPGEIVYANFVIERHGHLPVTFETVLPKDSIYKVQPQMGCITGKFQMFVVQFNGDNSITGTYRENLKIIYNDSPNNCDYVQFNTYVEIPELCFGSDNSFTFECTFPKAKTLAEIPVRNPTNLHLSYKFVTPEDIDWVEIINPEGSIEPMSSFLLKVIFKPEIVREYLDYIQCNVWKLSDQSYRQKEALQFQLIGSCQYGYLVATPSVHDFGECVYGVEQSVQISVFNFSSVALNFKLCVNHRAFPIGNVTDDVKIKPSRGVIPGKEKKRIDITIVPHGQDIFQYALMCHILENNSEETESCEEPRSIFLFRFEGVLPTFQIIDLNIENGGPLFSPHWIWKMLSVDKLNKALNSLKSEQEIDLRFPEAMIRSSPVTLNLLIEAKKYGEVSWRTDKKVFCPCVKNSNQPMTCMHSNAANWTPNIGTLSPGNRMVMNIVLGYEHPDEFLVQWTMNLPYNRKIVMQSTMVSLPEDEPSFTSMYMSPVFHLKPIFLGDMDPPVQLFWLYNNTRLSTSYVVDKLTLREGTISTSRIFDCINSNGVIPPFSCVPLIFLFKPNEMISYSTDFFVCTREDMPTKITLKGDGVLQAEQIKELSIEPTIPEKSILENPNVCLRSNVNVINIPYLQVFSDAKRLFFLCNTSATDVWAFHWHDFQANDLIEAKIIPAQGVIEPGQETILTLIVKSMCKPVFLNISIPCDVINYTSLIKYESALKYKKEMEEKAKDYFTITENGISYERLQIPIPAEPVPRHIFLTVNVNTISRTNIDQKLLLKQQMSLKSSEEVLFDIFPMPEVAKMMLPCIQNLLEKVLWDILHSKMFKYRVKNQQNTLDYGYRHIQPKADRKSIENFQRMTFAVSRNYIQDFLENILRNIVVNESELRYKRQT